MHHINTLRLCCVADMVHPMKSTIYRMHKRRHERLGIGGNGIAVDRGNYQNGATKMFVGGGIACMLLHYSIRAIRMIPK